VDWIFWYWLVYGEFFCLFDVVFLVLLLMLVMLVVVLGG